MELIMRILTAAVVGLVLASQPAMAQSLTSYESKFSTKETADRLVAELDKRGIKVAARVDHAAGAKSANLEMPPTEVIMFGNPRLGTPLMLAQPTVAIDLPMKVLVWQDSAGKVRVGYTPPPSLKDRHQLAGQDEVLKTMTGALDGIVKAASGQ
jgi:uncharacterized protein (DUF302 family)